MNCQECEEAIVTYREANALTQLRIDEHTKTCSSCAKALRETKKIEKLIELVANTTISHPNQAALTNKIMTAIPVAESKKGAENFWGFLENHFLKYTLAGLSMSLALFFCVELTSSGNEQTQANGPILQLQNVIINSAQLRSNFLKTGTNKKSILGNCLTQTQSTPDVACLKEKIKKLNF